jgi:hypothetical protein
MYYNISTGKIDPLEIKELLAEKKKKQPTISCRSSAQEAVQNWNSVPATTI